MPGNFKKEDLRILKTHRALVGALSSLLELQSFSHITVNDLCDEALISRTAFYSHFSDKYDLLAYWFSHIKLNIVNKMETYEDIEALVNSFVGGHLKAIKNLLENANSETLELVSSFLMSLLDRYVQAEQGEADPKNVVFFQFVSGGMVNYLQWQIKNKFPEGLQTMNSDFYDMLHVLLNWYTGAK